MNDNETVIMVQVKRCAYMLVKDMQKYYGKSNKIIYSELADLEKHEDRYQGFRIYLNNGAGHKMVNLLVYEDFLYYRTKLKDRNMARKVPPFSPADVRKNWGEYLTPVIVDQAAGDAIEAIDKIKRLNEMIGQVLSA